MNAVDGTLERRLNASAEILKISVNKHKNVINSQKINVTINNVI